MYLHGFLQHFSHLTHYTIKQHSHKLITSTQDTQEIYIYLYIYLGFQVLFL